jgi:hypothetical protein
MGFKKSFRQTSDKSAYPKWVEVELTEDEEKEAAKKARQKNVKIMMQCVDDARLVADEKDLDSPAVQEIAKSLFDKRASHTVFHKERRAREKFDKEQS